MVSNAVLLDTDVGTDVDDAIAIALLAAAPEINLGGVTTVSGDTTLRARIAKKLLTLGGRAGVPVAPGVRYPVLRQRNFLWLRHEGQGIVAPDEPLPLSTMHAVDLLIETVLRERPHIVAIGPLSNLAAAIMKEPAVISAVSEVTLMGGALHRDTAMPFLDYNLSTAMPKRRSSCCAWNDSREPRRHAPCQRFFEFYQREVHCCHLPVTSGHTLG